MKIILTWCLFLLLTTGSFTLFAADDVIPVVVPVAGATGPQGPPGLQGPAGPRGATGLQGASRYVGYDLSCV